MKMIQVTDRPNGRKLFLNPMGIVGIREDPSGVVALLPIFQIGSANVQHAGSYPLEEIKLVETMTQIQQKLTAAGAL